jgi:hypothetical protein
MRTATARIAKAIQPHCVLLDSSFCDAAAATAAGLTPDVVVAPEVVVVAGGGDTATTVVVWDTVTVGVDRVGAVTVGVDRVGEVTEGVGRVGVVRVPALVSVPPADSSRRRTRQESQPRATRSSLRHHADAMRSGPD